MGRRCHERQGRDLRGRSGGLRDGCRRAAGRAASAAEPSTGGGNRNRFLTPTDDQPKPNPPPLSSVPSNLASLELAQDPIGWQSRAESRHL